MPHSKSVAVFLERIILFFSDLTSHVLYLTEAIAPRHDAGKLIRQRRDNISDVWTFLSGNAQTSDTDDSHQTVALGERLLDCSLVRAFSIWLILAQIGICIGYPRRSIKVRNGALP